ncbi:phage gp36-like protein [Novosphingobium hassiacum]|uniref:Phage gp36-like protein n=1 Tax=Novosphingobium hassiacum TaxID=173676 RepID=A0A7W5ZTD9_9SPHN|nr:phage gp36-like protein [Novosphingobium hassiacum]
MPYASQQLLVDRYGERLLLQVADRSDPPAGTIDASVVARALSDTDAMIDGYLAGRYVLPLETTPPLLIDLAAQIAIYKLHIYAPDQKIADDYKDAVSALTKIANGVVRLPVAGVEPAGAGSAGVVTIDRERDFTPENLKGWI